MSTGITEKQETIEMTILVNERPKEAILLTEVRAMSSAYNFRRKYLELNPEVNPQNVIVYRYGRKGYPVCEVWELTGNEKGNGH